MPQIILPPRDVGEQLLSPSTLQWQERAGSGAAQHELPQRTRRPSLAAWKVLPVPCALVGG